MAATPEPARFGTWGVDHDEAAQIVHFTDRPVSPRELERMHSDRAQSPALPAVVIVGRGRVGGSLERAARRAGVEVTLAGREEIDEACAAATCALLCVPDGEIETAAGAVLAAAPGLRFLGHTSGAGGLDALAPAGRTGGPAAGPGPPVEAFSLHPLQTFPDRESDPGAAAAAVAGSSEAALELARALASRLGLEPFEVPEEARAAYHAAASIASNFLVALEESAVRLLDAAGVPGGRGLLAPLVLRSAANWAERGPEALTGPIARGDAATVRRHGEAIAALAPELADLYAALAARTADLAAAEAGR